jgi:hypothetical protein
MAVALAMNEPGMDAAPIAAATAYLRTHRTQVIEVRPDTLNIGFRVTAVEGPEDEAALVDLIDRALVRGRRHAVALAGSGLGRDLVRFHPPPGRRLPGVAGVAEAWADRRVVRRGMAAMVDVEEDVAGCAEFLDIAPGQRPRLVDGGPDTLAADLLVRCIAVALAAARHMGVYHWDGCFAVREAAEAAAWDTIERIDWSQLSLQSG